MTDNHVQNLLEGLLQLDDEAGPAQPLDTERSRELVHASMRRLGLAIPTEASRAADDGILRPGSTQVQSNSTRTVAPGPGDARASSRLASNKAPASRRYGRTGGFIVGSLIVASSAAAALSERSSWSAFSARWFEGSSSSSAPSTHPQTHATQRTSERPDDVARDFSPSPPPTETKAAAVAATREATPPAPVPSHQRGEAPFPEMGTDSADRTTATRRVVAHRDAAQPTATESATRLANDQLEAANRLRGQRHYRQARDAYLAVVQQHPGTRQAEAARVAAASLRLEHLADARGAAAEYAAAATRHGQLGEEASYGLAESHRAAGRAQAEEQQLKRFLHDYPKSALAPTARGRLEELATREH